MENVSDLIARIGRADFAQDGGFSQQSISRAITENMMPAGWYIAVRRMCGARDIATPEHLFRWAENRKNQISEASNDAR